MTLAGDVSPGQLWYWNGHLLLRVEPKRLYRDYQSEYTTKYGTGTFHMLDLRGHSVARHTISGHEKGELLSEEYPYDGWKD